MSSTPHRALVLLPLALCGLCVAGTAAADPPQGPAPDTTRVPVRVVEVAGGRAYVQPGARAGVRRGDVAIIARRRYRVVAASASTAIVAPLDGRAPRTGSRGVVHASARAGEEEGEPLPLPRRLAAFRGQWPEATRPAEAQTPEHVPLGAPAEVRGRTRVALSLGGQALVPVSGDREPIGRAELRARLHAEPLSAAPLSLDADVAAQLWLAADLDARRGAGSRPALHVRELQAAYGRSTMAAAGRLRHAARGLGALDGLRVQVAPVDGLTAAAFGGLVPDPLDSSPGSGAARFGAEVAYEDASAALRPRGALTAHASRFDGQLDERRLAGQLDLFPGRSRVGGHFELSLFDADNPWGAPEQQLTAAGADTSLRFGAVEVGGRFDMQHPERSLWLASFLPPEWLCVPRAGAAIDALDECAASSAIYTGQLDVGLHLERSAITIGGSLRASGGGDLEQRALFANLRVLQLIGALRLDLGALATDGTLLRSVALPLALGVPLLALDLDLSLRYRPALLQYQTGGDAFLQHTAGLGLGMAAAPTVQLGLDADLTTGSEVDLAVVQLLTTWRP